MNARETQDRPGAIKALLLHHDRRAPDDGRVFTVPAAAIRRRDDRALV